MPLHCFRNVFTPHKGFNDSPPWQTCHRGRFSDNDNNVRPHPIVNGSEKRPRIALLNVDYVTSFELPFRLLLTRTPQLIAALREEWGLSQKNVVFNDKRFGCVYSLKASLSGVPGQSAVLAGRQNQWGQQSIRLRHRATRSQAG